MDERTMDTTTDLDLSPDVRGALRSAIHAHGPITEQWIGSATKRIVHGLREKLARLRGERDAARREAERLASVLVDVQSYLHGTRYDVEVLKQRIADVLADPSAGTWFEREAYRQRRIAETYRTALVAAKDAFPQMVLPGSDWQQMALDTQLVVDKAIIAGHELAQGEPPA